MEEDDDGVNLSQYMHETARPLVLVDSQTGSHFMDFSGVQPPEEDRRRGKTMHDPIHGDMYLLPAGVAVMDTCPVQRLRELKQLGAGYYVFPGASHNRFEHSVGVAHLAYRYGNRLYHLDAKNRRMDHGYGECMDTSNEMTRPLFTALTLAGLCHDLGHGPFSHLFERSFLRRIGVDWSHEDMSVKLFDSIVDEGVLEGYSGVDDTVIKEVKVMITACDNSRGASVPRGWRYELVANGRNGLDVDKFDYLKRDAFYAGVKIAADFDRINKFSMIIGDEICYKYEAYRDVFEVYHSRATMYDTVYSNSKVKAVDAMIADALIAAEPALHLKDKLYDVDQFLALDDTVLKDIEFFEMKRGKLDLDMEGEKGLRKAQQIIRRLRNGDKYKLASEALVPKRYHAELQLPKPAELVALNRAVHVRLVEEDILVDELKVDYTSGDSNPVDKVHFYDKRNPTVKFDVSSKDVVWNLPQEYMQRRIRVYSRNSEPEVVSALTEAFQEWTKRRWRGEVQATPARRCDHVDHVVLPAEKKRKLFKEVENQHPSQSSLSISSH